MPKVEHAQQPHTTAEMTKKSKSSQTSTSRRAAVAFAGAVFTILLYVHGVPNHPPGFYIDESSIAYNAYTISQTGRDEHGTRWPLYFQSFGEFKNPTYVYLLAGLFRLFGPGILTARLFSATCGVLTVALLWLLAFRLTRRESVAYTVALSALLTPWLYESSRLVFEIALYPALVALFLLALQRAADRESWTLSDVCGLASTLALVTYSASIGRLLGPLLAAGLVLFMTRRRGRGVVLTWLAYTLTLVPLLVFHLRHPGALTARFRLITYLTPHSSAGEIVVELMRRFAFNLSPWRMLLTGETNIRDHVGGVGSLLAPTFVLALAGILIVLRSQSRSAWWRFVLYGLAASVVPASLTDGVFPQLRLIAFPVFLHTLVVPAVTWLLARAGEFRHADDSRTGSHTPAHDRRRAQTKWRVVILLLVVFMLAQGAYFQWLYQRPDTERAHMLDDYYPTEVLHSALATGVSNIYVYDPPGRAGYIQALWYGVVWGVEESRFMHVPAGSVPPSGAVVISTEDVCAHCRLIVRSGGYLVYVAGADGDATR